MTFMFLWLTTLTIWAVLHIRKSSETWDNFEEIDERLRRLEGNTRC